MTGAFRPAVPFYDRVAEVRPMISRPELLAVFDKAMAGVDVRRLERLRARYAPEREMAGTDMLKAFDIPLMAKGHLGLFAALNLAASPPLRILDLGAGPGHFLALCKAAGHDVLAADVDWPELNDLICSDICAVMGVERRICEIRASRPIPIAGRFDVITAHGVCFDFLWQDSDDDEDEEEDHPSGRRRDAVKRDREERATKKGEPRELWSPAEWRFAIRDMRERLLAPGGRIQIALNPRPYDHILDLFEEMGATVNRRRRWAHFQT